MPRYDFRCQDGHEQVAAFAMSDVPGAVPCTACDAPARRVITAPQLGRTTSAAFRLIESTERSAHEPEVVSGSLPGARPGAGAPVSRNPLHRRLPRP